MTLIESLVTLAVMVLISAIAFPAMDKSAQSLARAYSRVQLASDIRVAHARALAQDRPVSLALRRGGAAYAVDGALQSLPQGTLLSLDQGMAMTFYPDGSASGGRLVLHRAGRADAIEIDPATSAQTAVALRPDE